MRLLWSVKLGLDPQACQNVLQVHFLLGWSIVLCTPCWFSMRALQAYKAKTILNWKTICRQVASASGSASWTKYCLPVLQTSLFFNKFILTPPTLWVQRCAGRCRARKYGDPRCHNLVLNKLIATWLCCNEVWKFDVLGFLADFLFLTLLTRLRSRKKSSMFSFFCLVSRKTKLALLEKQKWFHSLLSDSKVVMRWRKRTWDILSFVFSITEKWNPVHPIPTRNPDQSPDNYFC